MEFNIYKIKYDTSDEMILNALSEYSIIFLNEVTTIDQYNDYNNIINSVLTNIIYLKITYSII